MNAHGLFIAVAILGGLGLAFALLIAFAQSRLYVWEDPRIDGVAALLPNANCGACGLPGCRAFAEKAVAGAIQPAQCTVSSADKIAEIAHYLGVDAGAAVKRVARLLCAGGTDVAVQQADYTGLPSCAAAAAVASGGKGCTWGCIGLADCERACTFDAIHMNATLLPVVDVEKCTACGDCVDACPKDLFTILPLDQHLLVQCKSALAGDPIVALCGAACNACGRCVQDAAPGLIRIENGLAVIDPARIALADPRATSRCPTGAIVWLEGAQFAAGAKTAAGAAEGSRVA